MKHTIKKSELINTLSGKSKIKENKKGVGKQIKLSEEQFTRLLETFGDGDLELSNPAAQSMVTQSADDYYMDTESASELDEDLNDFLGNMNELDDSEEDLDEMWGTLAKMAASAAGAAAVDKLSDKYLEEKDEMMESIRKTYKLIRERIKIERPKGLKLMEYNSKTLKKAFLTEAQDEWRGKNPGVSAAAGIENIINSIKKGYDFIRDSRTKKQIENTLTKINNFMTYTAELIGSGQSQRQARTYDQVANPLPYPELEQSAEDEAFEDIDDEINITEAYARIGVSARNIPRQYKRRLAEADGEEKLLSYEVTAPESWYRGIHADGSDCGDEATTKYRNRLRAGKEGEQISLYNITSCPIYAPMFDTILGWADWTWPTWGGSEGRKNYDKIAAQIKKDKARFAQEKAAGTTYEQLYMAGIINHDGTPGPNSQQGKVASAEMSREKLVQDLGYTAGGIYRAVKGLGTDEDALFYHLGELKEFSEGSGKSVADIVKQLSAIYQKKYGETLMDALKGDLSGGDLRKALGLLNERYVGGKRRLSEIQGINPERIAKELHDAMDGLGTNEKKFWNIIQPTGREGLTVNEMDEVRDAFKNLYDDDLCDWIKGDFSGDERTKALNAVGCGGNSGMRGLRRRSIFSK